MSCVGGLTVSYNGAWGYNSLQELFLGGRDNLTEVDRANSQDAKLLSRVSRVVPSFSS